MIVIVIFYDLLALLSEVETATMRVRVNAVRVASVDGSAHTESCLHLTKS
jgi:hypothetical protein